MVRFETLKNNSIEKYRVYLQQKGFTFFGDAPYGELWHGIIRIEENDITSDLCICFPQNFPYENPVVYALSDMEFIKTSRHQNDNFLCLWHEGEWNANITPEEFYNRIEMWFKHSKNNDWDNKDRRADLDRHFHSNNILAISDDEWMSFSFDCPYGYYNYVLLSSKDFTQGVFIYNPSNGVIKDSGLFLSHPSTVPLCNSIILKEFRGFKQNEDNTKGGLWLFCKEEIKPCKTFQELKAQISALCDISENVLNDEFKMLLNENKNIMFSIIYNDCNGKRQYIHFDYNQDDDVLATFKTSNCDEYNLSQRISHLKMKIQDKKVAIFGIGAIGSFVADSLGRHGLNEIKLIDYDTLEPQNIIRHALSSRYVGIKKASAMAHKISNVSLGFTKIKSYANPFYETKVIIDIIKDVDVVVDCTANKNFSLMLNHLCTEYKKLVVYITSHKKATIGKIIVVKPGIDPCLCCYYGKNGIVDNYDKFDYPYIQQDENDEIVLSCGDITYPGVSSDIEMIAIWGVKIILWLLQDKFDSNYCLIVNEVQEGEDINPIFKRIGHTFKTFKKMEGCEICA